MNAERDFRWLGTEPDPERYIPRVASWIHESGNPYYDSFFGGPEAAEAALLRWVGRPTSEIALEHVIGLFEDDELAGLIVVLSGPELASCTRADALAALREVGRTGRAALVARTRMLAGLRPVPRPDEFYLGKMTVDSSKRGGGRGRALFQQGVIAGQQAGFRRFRCEARAGDAGLIGLYGSEGFRIVEETRCRMPGQELKIMVRIDPD